MQPAPVGRHSALPVLRSVASMKPRMPNSPPAVALDAARAHIAELEAAQPDQKSLFGFDLKNDKPDNIAEAIIGNVDLGRAEKIARAILKAVKAKSQKPGPDHAVDSDHHLTHQRPTARGPVTSPAAASTNRGVAPWKDKVISIALDGRMFAINKTTSEVVW